jgi:hypothetical protein
MQISFTPGPDARLTAATLTLPETTETPLAPHELANPKETLRISRFHADWQSQMRGVPESALLLFGMALVTFTSGVTVLWMYRHHIPGYVPATAH